MVVAVALNRDCKMPRVDGGGHEPCMAAEVLWGPCGPATAGAAAADHAGAMLAAENEDTLELVARD